MKSVTPHEGPGAGQRRPRRSLRAWRYGFLMAVGMMTVVASATVGIFIGIVRSLPPIEKLEYYDPPEITRVYDRSGAIIIGEFKKQGERRQLVRIKEIPKKLRNAFIAVEDNRFYEHFGLDIFGIFRAVVANYTAGGLRQGASTITQQMTRNVLPEVGNKRTMMRKLKEAILSVQIERRYSKDQILEFYLNQIAFGNNAFGVWAAATTYFSKDLRDLTLGECAVLAAIPKANTTYNPILHPDRAKARRNVVLKGMLDLKMITKKDYDEAVAEPLRVRPGTRATSRYPQFVDGLRRDMIAYYGLDEKRLEQGGLRIVSSLDPAIQEACIKALRDDKKGLPSVERKWQAKKQGRLEQEMKKQGSEFHPSTVRLMEITKVDKESVSVRLGRYHGTIPLPDQLPFYHPEEILKKGELLDVRINDLDQNTGEIQGKLGTERPVQGSMVVLDAHNGEVLAMVGGSNYNDQSGGWNFAMQGGRQPGSCFKPFFYATAFEKGYSPSEVIVDEPIEYNSVPKPYRPINYEKNFEGPMTLIRALEHSRNVVTLRLFESLRIKPALDVVRRFDFLYEQSNKGWDFKNAGISVCLGTIDTSPFELTAAYMPFVNLGVGIRPRFFSNILDAEGKAPTPIRRPEERQIISPIAAYQTQYVLRQVVRSGTGKTYIGDANPSPPAPPICGKTGTTTDCIDAWFVGFTPDLVIACQVGFEPRLPMGAGMTGSSATGPIWAAAFKDIIKSGKNWKMSFDAPEGIELADICSRTGKRAGEGCEDGHGEYTNHVFHNVPFPVGKAPRERCDGTPGQLVIAPVSSTYADLARLAQRTGFAHARTDGGGGGEADASDE